MAKHLFYNKITQNRGNERRAETERKRNMVVESLLQINICTSGRCAAVLDVFRSYAYVIEN